MRERVACYFLLGKLGALYSAGLNRYAEKINALKGTNVSVRDYGYWHPFTSARNHHSANVIERAKSTASRCSAIRWVRPVFR